MTREPSITLTFRAPKSMVVELDQMAGELGRERSECIREAIAQYLDAGPNSLQRRVTILEQRMDSVSQGVGQFASGSGAGLRPDRDEAHVAELESQLSLATTELSAARSAIETLEALIQEGGGSTQLSQWLVQFRRDHPPS